MTGARVISGIESLGRVLGRRGIDDKLIIAFIHCIVHVGIIGRNEESTRSIAWNGLWLRLDCWITMDIVAVSGIGGKIMSRLRESSGMGALISSLCSCSAIHYCSFEGVWRMLYVLRGSWKDLGL